MAWRDVARALGAPEREIREMASAFDHEEADLARAELWLNLGDAHHQAARFSVSAETSTPSLNLIPSMTFGNWFLPLRRSHFFDAA